MKTKLFSLFIAVFLFSISGKSQTNAKTAVTAFPVITLIGSGNGGWTDSAETPMLTDDGTHYSLVDKILTDGEVKFREGKCWGTGCAVTVTNPYGWGPTDAAYTTDAGWPSGTNAAPVDAGKNIVCKAGVWTVTFNRIDGTWSFVPGKPLPVIKLVGTAVSTSGGAVLTSDLTGTFFSAKKVTLVPGNCQISVDGVLAGAVTFPNGDAVDGSDNIPVTTTGIDYDVTFDYTLYKYTFTVATFPIIDIIGNGTTGNESGWGSPIDMVTTDGETYTLKNLKLYATSSDSNPVGGAAGVKFRLGHSWDTNWGGNSFPTGPTGGNDNIMVSAGTYDVTFNLTTHAYTFSFPIIDLIGNGTTGNESGWGTPIDMATTDGVNYTVTQTLFATSSDSNPVGGAAGVKFRLGHSWDTNWGGNSFPTGPTGSNDNIMVNAGTYAVKFNRLTGAYDFGTALAVKNFSAGSFKAYPNPTQNSWTISGGTNKITSVHVYDMLGRSVYAKATSSNDVSVNASALSKGTYFAKVSTENGTSTVKLVKE